MIWERIHIIEELQNGSTQTTRLEFEVLTYNLFHMGGKEVSLVIFVTELSQ
jgi:hypothetical protein